MPVTLVCERNDIVRPIPEIAFKGLQNSYIEIVDRLSYEAIMPCLARRNGERQRASEGDDNSIFCADQKIGVLGFRRTEISFDIRDSDFQRREPTGIRCDSRCQAV